ncbi:MAG: hypothetical protein NVSMB22_27770 [Chloroflexota bacterium]
MGTVREGWTEYRQVRAGYEVEYPASWMVADVIANDASVTTSFTPAEGGIAISVTAGEGDPVFT